MGSCSQHFSIWSKITNFSIFGLKRPQRSDLMLEVSRSKSIISLSNGKLRFGYSRVSNSRASTHLFFSVIFPDTRSYWLPHDFRNDIMARKFFSILKNWEFFNKKYIRLITHVMKIDRKRRKCSFTTFLVVFWDSCNFGYFLKNPRSTLIRCPHDFRFFTIFPQSRLLDAHGY